MNKRERLQLRPLWLKFLGDRTIGFVSIGVLIYGWWRSAQFFYQPPENIVALSQSPSPRRIEDVEWFSSDPLIKSQEIRQWQWEQQNLQKNFQKERVRADFQRLIKEHAETSANEALQTKAKELLETASRTLQPWNANVTDAREVRERSLHAYDDIIVAVELNSDFLTRPDGIAGERNNIVGGNGLLRALNGSCVVYGAGIDYEASFEVSMSRDYGCAVHAFDCTMSGPKLKTYLQKQALYHSLAFHRWCIGQEKESDTVIHSQQQKEDQAGRATDALVPGGQNHVRYYGNQAMYDYDQFDKSNFFTLDKIVQHLGHEEVDILKFDIEGFEWALLLDVILVGRRLPRQLHFELHAMGAKKQFVPEPLQAGRDRLQIVNLFRVLFNRGYRVVTKEVNPGDAACAEFVLYRFYND